MLWTFRKDNEQDIFHLANRDVSVFLITMQLVKHLNPCFISENQSGILKADAMFSPIPVGRVRPPTGQGLRKGTSPPTPATGLGSGTPY